MITGPPIGSVGGQRYDIARAIGTWLRQMSAEQGFRCGPAVIKELIQNADDAGASELRVILDERIAPPEFPAEYKSLVGPALLVSNDSRFRKGENPESDDFQALCDVAGGHKLVRATAAGRFGIGFNSVYFLTDTPIIFSRREVHIFDLLHVIFNENGWKFPLDDFPAHASTAGPIKQVLDRALPKSVIGGGSFGGIAQDGTDYQHTVFRLPLRLRPVEGERLADETFPTIESRRFLLKDICLQAAQSLLFLKSVREVSVSSLTENGLELLATASINPNPTNFEHFRKSIDEEATSYTPGRALRCDFYRRTIEIQSHSDDIKTASWSFFVKHAASFDNQELCELRKHLHRNNERAIPWVSLAIPENPTSLYFEGNKNPSWRVFLPLLEQGPCGCVLNAHLFVGPSRQGTEFRTGESSDDEALRKTSWNKALVDQALIPLLSDASDEILQLIPDFVEKYPREYLSLFPRVLKKSALPDSLAAYLQRQFEASDRLLRLYDLWKDPLELLFDKSGEMTQLEMIPEWVAEYGPLFKHLRTEERSFVTFSLGKALREHLSDDGSIKLRWDVAPDVVREILTAESAPHSKDLEALLTALDSSERTKTGLEGLWCFQRSDETVVIKFDQSVLYLLGATPSHENLLKKLLEIGLQFSKTEWVSDKVGLAALPEQQRSDFDQLVLGDDNALITLLRRAENGRQHDMVSNPEMTWPLIEFLCEQSRERLGNELQLGFLVTTATNKRPRRRLGAIFLKPCNPTRDDEVLWEGLLRRTFAEVEPRFAGGLHKLLHHAPELLDCLNAEDCRVEIVSASRVVEVLHRAMVASPDAREVFAKELNRPGENQSRCRNEAYEAASRILEDAERRWDELGEEVRTTVLRLPIHRLADGTLVSLLNNEHATCESLKKAFFLQSEDDVTDAPLKLEKRVLLHSVNRIARRFYRTRLEISEHGHIEVLKEALRQVGTDAQSSDALLVYVARHYQDTIEELKRKGAETQRDVEELSALFIAARIVPCLDGIWHRLDECVEGSVAATVLKRQRWHDEELEKILIKLAHPRAVATLDPRVFRFVAQLRSLDGLRPDELGLLAIASEAEDFGLRDRAKIYLRNKPLSSEANPVRASLLDTEVCSALGGTVELKDLELLDLQRSTLGVPLLQRLFPNAANINEVARQLGVEKQEAFSFLKALNVLVRTITELDEALTQRFDGMWPSLNDSERFELLGYVAAREVLVERLGIVAPSLDVVKVESGEWACPDGVLSPKWTSTQPPANRQILSKISDVSPHVLDLWNKWCGVNTIEQVVGCVIAYVKSVPAENRVQTWKEMVQWLECAINKAGAEETGKALEGQAWVLARKRSEEGFQRAEETLFHSGADVLSHEFWVVLGETPSELNEYVSFKTLEPDAETIEMIAKCLVDAVNSPREAVLDVYKEVVRLINQQETLAMAWERIAEQMPVYRLFRVDDVSVSGNDLFLGDREYASDFGGLLKCFSQEAMDEFRQAVRRTYKQLSVAVQPSPQQLLSALSKTCGQDKQFREVHRELVEALTNLNPDENGIGSDLLTTVGVLSCSGIYEPLANCYQDDQLRSPELIDERSRCLLVDGRDRPTTKLLKWIGNRPTIVRELSLNAHRVLLNEPSISPVSAAVTRIVQPWHIWLGQLANQDATLRAEVSEKIGWVPPTQRIEIVPVEEIRIRYELKDGGEILPSSKWLGPKVCHDSANRILIAKHALNEVAADKLEDIDEIVTEEVLHLLRHLEGAPTDEAVADSFRDIVRRTLERPSVVLRHMKSEKEEHFFHQYLDQAADPEFADTFDEYRQLSQSSARRKELSDLLWRVIADKFVQARREQIRGYGYDEFSVFAELVQNAEDAYAQSLVLEMDSSQEKSLTFSYSTQNSKLVLTVEHSGRPFNYWIHGARSEQAYKRDVEGVLKSAGSFKPHVKVEDQYANTVGRFGLGFKSVYLITAQPTIYSGDWHFTINSGCIPEEVNVPEDLPLGMTRFVLPLLDEAQEEEDRGRHGQGERFVNLVPFLRQINYLNLKRSDGTSLDLHVQVRTLAGQDDDENVIEQVQVSGPTHVRGRTVNFIRLRSRNSDAQLALYLGEDGLPAPWKEGFLWDAFAVLPLRVELGCGVAVSHMFQVQSGRTHLIDPEANKKKVAEVSALIQAVPQVMNALLNDQRSSFDFVRRFWSIWRWDRGDNEATDLRRGIAFELVVLAERALVVPTLNRDEIVTFDGRPLFCFESVPEEFCRELLEAGAEVSISGRSITLRDSNVVPEWFLSTYDRICVAAMYRSLHTPQRIGWADVGHLCLNRPLLAEKPDLVSVMARTLGEAEILQVVEWLPKCLLRMEDGGSEVVSKLLPWSFSGVDYLPTRLIRRLDKRYDEDAVGLLKRAGLRSRPSVDDLETWIDSKLQAHECIGLIRYLSDQGRWRRDFYRVAPKLQESWFVTGKGKITSGEAFERGLITVDLVGDPLFRAWLGIRFGDEPTPDSEPPLEPPSLNSRAVLEAIYEWWSIDREALTRQYETRVYIDATPPKIRQDFLPSNGRDRESWLVLLILGATHTMGRTRPEQHREFLRHCKDQGWLDVFADPTLHAEKWMGILEGYLSAQITEAIFFEWVKQFVSIFQLANWLQDYVEAFLAIDQLGTPFSLDSVTRSGTSEIWQGGGPDAPSLTRTLGMGACFVVRELVRLNVLQSEHAYPHCYVPVLRVRQIFERLGCTGILDQHSYRTSERIYCFLVDTFGGEDIRKVTFDHSFDIPFLLIADNPDLQQEFFDTQLNLTDEEELNP